MLLHDPVLLLQALLLALVVDALVGDPPWLWRRLSHPVALFGRLAAALERRSRGAAAGARALRMLGAALTFALVSGAALLGFLIDRLLWSWGWGWAASGLVASLFLAYRGLSQHVAAVAQGLRQDLERGRGAVRHIVGRDPEALDRAGVARAAVESLAENFADGVVAPWFGYLMFGLPGLLVIKAANTLDSMWGYRSPAYRHFGAAAARLDDLLQYLPARITALLFLATAALLPHSRAGAALQVVMRDARKHRSPNAGYPEGALAGALGYRLAGPRIYRHETVDGPWIGQGKADLGAEDIDAALAFAGTAFRLLVLFTAALMVWAAAPGR